MTGSKSSSTSCKSESLSDCKLELRVEISQRIDPAVNHVTKRQARLDPATSGVGEKGDKDDTAPPSVQLDVMSIEI